MARRDVTHISKGASISNIIAINNSYVITFFVEIISAAQPDHAAANNRYFHFILPVSVFIITISFSSKGVPSRLKIS